MTWYGTGASMTGSFLALLGLGPNIDEACLPQLSAPSNDSNDVIQIAGIRDVKSADFAIGISKLNSLSEDVPGRLCRSRQFGALSLTVPEPSL